MRVAFPGIRDRVGPILAAMAAVAVCVAWVPPRDAPTGATVRGVDVPTVTATNDSLGVIEWREDFTIGWVAAPGVVMTGTQEDLPIGESVKYTPAGSSNSVNCYVASMNERQRLAALRCPTDKLKPLEIERRYPMTGTPVTSFRLVYPAIEPVAGTVTNNAFLFMGENHLQFDFNVGPQGGASIASETYVGTPVIDSEGKVLTVLMAAPNMGGRPIGASNAAIVKQRDTALSRPDSFSAAATSTAARHALIPALVGLGIGLLYGLSKRSSAFLGYAVAGGFLGAVVAVVYVLFQAVVIGPQTLLQ
ncbi:MAG: hypothetical protein R2698_06970 [Microthrixaceae bacterium]